MRRRRCIGALWLVAAAALGAAAPASASLVCEGPRCPHKADLAIAIEPLQPAHQLVVSYTLTVTNHGPERANAVSVRDLQLSPWARVKTAFATQGTCSVHATAVSCAVGAIEPRATARITVVVRPVLATPARIRGATRVASQVSSTSADRLRANNRIVSVLPYQPAPETYWQSAENGCGPGNVVGLLIPDAVGIHYNFLPACNAHDGCYSRPGATKAQCDAQFLIDLRSLCASQWWRPPTCYAAAELYHLAVSTLGGPAYEQAQQAALAGGHVAVPAPPR